MIKKISCIFFLILLIAACKPNSVPQALGVIEKDRITLMAKTSENLKAVHVQEGDWVEEGQILLEFDTAKQELIVKKAKANVEALSAQLSKLEQGARDEDIEQAESKLAQAEAQHRLAKVRYDRAKELGEKNLSSQARIDEALAQFLSAEADLKVAKSELNKLKNGTRAEDIKNAQANWMVAKADLQLQEKILKDLTFYATRSGYVDKISYLRGDYVTTGMPLISIQTNDQAYAHVYIGEPYRAEMKIGDKLKVYIDGFDEYFTGTLLWISREAAFTPYYALNATDRARLAYLAKIKLPVDANEIVSGVPVQVDLSKGHPLK